MEEENIDIYEPEIVKQEPLDVESPDETFDDVTKGGLIHTKLNQAVIIQRIAKDLYKNPTSGMRELFNNSARACRIANKQYKGKEAFVKVTIDKANRLLVIEDVNATGISIARFKKVLLELGTSDNLDGTEVGQFGMGFASYTTLSSALILESKSRVKDSKGEFQNYKMVAKDGMSFQPVGKSKLEAFGTRLTMTLYEEVVIDDLVKILKKLVRYCGVKTVVDLKNYEADDYNDEMQAGEITYDSDTIWSVMETLAEDDSALIRFDNDDYEFCALVSGQPMARTSLDNEVLIVGTPIEAEEIKFPFDHWVLNIKNERKYKPMPDRDRLTEKAEVELQGILWDLLADHFAKIDVTNYESLKVSPYKHEFLWLLRGRGDDYIPARLSELVATLRVSVKKAGAGKSATHHTVGELFNEYEDIVYMKNPSNAAVRKMQNLFDSVFCFTFTKGKKNKLWEEKLDDLVRFGVKDSTEIFKEYRIKIIHEKKKLGDIEVIAHMNETGSYMKKDLAIEDIDEMTMMIDKGNTNDVISIVRRGYCPFKVIRMIKEFKDTDVRLWSEFVADLENLVVSTNKGAMTLKEFESKVGDKYICQDFEAEYEPLACRTEALVMLDPSHFFAYRVYLTRLYDDPERRPNHLSISTLIHNIAHVHLSDTRHQKFFNAHYDDMFHCHWRIFAKALSNINSLRYDVRESEDEFTIRADEFLEIVNALPRFDEKSPYKFVEWLEELKSKFGEDSSLGSIIYSLLNEIQREIENNQYVFAISIKKIILPKLFKDFEVTYLKTEDQGYRGRIVKVTVKTLDPIVLAVENHKIFNWNLDISITKVIRDGDYNKVSMELKF